MAEKRSGLAPVPSGLFRPTTQAVADGPVDEPATADGESRGDEPAAAPAEAPARPRVRRKAAAPVKTRARNLHLSDDVHDRLWQLARQRRQTASAVAEDLLNRSLPRWEIKRQG